jgi:hypothetical protein
MRLRRFFALLTSITLLHLSVVSGDAACATHGTNGETSMMSGHEMPTDGHPMPMPAATQAGGAAVVTSDAPPCETPVALHCCDAVAGCGPTGIIARSLNAVALERPLAARISRLLDDAPASFASAPEPPPPKA